MSVSPNCNLYCNESSGDVVSLDADICSDIHESFDHSTIDDTDDENYIVSIFNSEDDHQKQRSEFLAKYRKLPELVTARQEAVSWMLKAHLHCRFRPETAYISVNYLDRFLLSHTNSMKPGKGWQLWKLLSVACLAVAAKMEETSVPNLLDLQLIEPSRFLFKPKTVHRMEVLVMSSLKWRLRTITPFDFVYYFISKISCFISQHNGHSSVFSLSSDLIISTMRVIDFWDYPPSTIAAAVVLWATNHTVDDQNFGCFHKRVNKEMVKGCYNLVRKKMSQLLHIEVAQRAELVASSNGKLGLVFRGGCDDLETSKEETKSSQDLLTNKH